MMKRPKWFGIIGFAVKVTEITWALTEATVKLTFHFETSPAEVFLPQTPVMQNS